MHSETQPRKDPRPSLQFRLPLLKKYGAQGTCRIVYRRLNLAPVATRLKGRPERRGGLHSVGHWKLELVPIPIYYSSSCGRGLLNDTWQQEKR